MLGSSPYPKPTSTTRNPKPIKNPKDPITQFNHLLSHVSLPLLHLSFPSLFKSCANLAAVEQGRQLHCQAIKRGSHSDVAVQRSIIRFYSQCLACEDAVAAFGQCENPAVVSGNDLLLGLCRIGDLENARMVFDRMRERNVVSWSVLVDGYGKNGQMEIARKLFDEMPERNEFAWNSLISGYLRCGEVEVARRVFDSKVSEWNVVTWTAMISGCVQNGEFKQALDLFVDMQIAGVMPNEVTLVSILPAVAHLGALSQGRWIHAYIDKMGIQLDDVLGSALVDMYSKCGCIDDAIAIFESLNHKTLSSWNSIISGLASHGRGQEALHFFSRLRDKSQLKPNDITFIAVLSACSHSRLVDEGLKCFHLFTNHYKLTPNIMHYGCMVDLLGRAGLVEEALELVEKMPSEPNLVIWKALLSACRVHRKLEMVDHILRRVNQEGDRDSGFCSLVRNVFREAGRRDEVGEVRREMNDSEVHRAAGCSWVEVDGVVIEFFSGQESFHEGRDEMDAVLSEMERLMKLENL